MLMHKGGFNPCKKLFIQLSLINLTNIICLNNFLHFDTKKNKQENNIAIQLLHKIEITTENKKSNC